MPVPLDLRQIKDEAKQLLQTASVPPIRFTILFLAINLVLSEISTAVDWFVGDPFADVISGAASGVSDIAATLPSLPLSFVSILVSLLATVLSAGFVCYCLAVHRGAHMPYESLFDAFPFAGKVILLTLLEAVLIALGLMIFIVPGIYLAFCYAFAIYHICEKPEIGVIEALRRSREETRGRKWQLFLLLISFWPLLLGAGLAGFAANYLFQWLPHSLGGSLLFTLISGVVSGCVEAYLLPYMRLATVGFYRRAAALRIDDPLQGPEL